MKRVSVSQSERESVCVRESGLLPWRVGEFSTLISEDKLSSCGENDSHSMEDSESSSHLSFQACRARRPSCRNPFPERKERCDALQMHRNARKFEKHSPLERPAVGQLPRFPAYDGNSIANFFNDFWFAFIESLPPSRFTHRRSERRTAQDGVCRPRRRESCPCRRGFVQGK